MGLARVEISYPYLYPCKPAGKPAWVCEPVLFTSRQKLSMLPYLKLDATHARPVGFETFLKNLAILKNSLFSSKGIMTVQFLWPKTMNSITKANTLLSDGIGSENWLNKDFVRATVRSEAEASRKYEIYGSRN